MSLLISPFCCILVQSFHQVVILFPITFHFHSFQVSLVSVISVVLSSSAIAIICGVLLCCPHFHFIRDTVHLYTARFPCCPEYFFHLPYHLPYLQMLAVLSNYYLWTYPYFYHQSSLLILRLSSSSFYWVFYNFSLYKQIKCVNHHYQNCKPHNGTWHSPSRFLLEF